MKTIIQSSRILILFILISACSFKLKIPVHYYSEEDMVSYVQKMKYPFDAIMYFKDSSSYSQSGKNKIERLTFMNLYSKDNRLLKATDGDNCEFKIASFIRDSLAKAVEDPHQEYSLDAIYASTNTARLQKDVDILSKGKYKILVGWSIGLNEYRMVRKRLSDLLGIVQNFHQESYIIGLNLDGVK